MERNDPCWCGSGKKYKKCHMPIEEKIKLHRDRGEIVPSRKQRQSICRTLARSAATS